MKKITSFLSLMLMAFSTTAMGQVWIVDEEADGIITDPAQITSPYTTNDGQTLPEGATDACYFLLDGDPATYWHSKWENGAVAEGTHYFQVENIEWTAETETMFGFEFTRRANANNQITKWSVWGVPAETPAADKDDCTRLAVVETPWVSGNYGPFYSRAIEHQGFTTLRFYAESTDGNQKDKGFWHIAEFQIKPVIQGNAANEAYKEFMLFWETYSTYSFTEDQIGTAPGQYSAEAVAAFEAAKAKGTELENVDPDNVEATHTAQQIKDIMEEIKTTYQAVLDSIVPFASEIKPGYYVIKSALDFKKTVTIPGYEDEETGETVDPQTIVKHRQKAIYENNGTANWMDYTGNAKFLFKVEATDKARQYKVTNMHNGYTFNPVAQSTAVTMAATDSLIVFDWAANDIAVYDTTEVVEGEEPAKRVTAYNIRLASQAQRGYQYIHCNGHGGGANASGNIVGWCNTYDLNGGSAGASEWYLEEIDEATAQAWIDADSPQKVITAMIDSVAAIKTTFADQKVIAVDYLADLDEENPIITDASQFSSPFSQNDLGDSSDGGNLADGVLIDGNSATYWHSYWGGGNVEPGTHYLQVAEVDAQNVAFVITRRACDNDHPAVISVYGFDADDEALTKEDGELLATCNIGYSSNTETKTSDVFATKGHTVLRFYNEESAPISANRGYWHASEFQLYPASVGYGAETTQATARAEQIAAIEAALAAWDAKNYTVDSVATPDDAEFAALYNAVIDANNAWTAVFADPAALRQTIADNAIDEKFIKIGTNPGEWSAASVDAVKNAIADAEAYNNAGAYSAEELEAKANAIVEAKTNLIGSANKVQTGKWYKFRMPTEAECEANEWGDICAPTVAKGEGYEIETTRSIYGFYATIGNVIATETDVEDVKSNVFEGVAAEDVSVGARLLWMPEGDNYDEDDNLFQFIAVGDTAYMIQHKNTGLYLKTGNSGAITLSAMPSFFKQSALGYGSNLIESVQFDTLYNHRYMHGQCDGAVVCTWEAKTVGSRSSIFIEEAGDVADFVPTKNFTVNVYRGKVNTYCWPVDVKLTDEEANIYGVQVEENKLTLIPVQDNLVKAGTPYVLIANLADFDDEYVNEADDEGVEGRYHAVAFEFAGTELNTIARTWKSLVGNYYGAKVPKGSILPKENGFQAVKGTSQTIGGNAAYIAAELDENPETGKWPTIEVEIAENSEIADNINTVITQVSKNGAIYTIDGKFVGNGNINTVKNMGRGIYVINGVKVAVK